MITILTGFAEFAAWIAFIYFMASDLVGRVMFDVTGWAEKTVKDIEAKYGD